MRASRLILLLIVAGAGLYILKNYSGLFRTPSSDAAAGTASPIDRARAVRDQNDRKNAERDSASRQADSAPAAGVTENMTPDQVRALLGPPDEIESATADNGRSRETWTYRKVGKTVVFENGVAVSVR